MELTNITSDREQEYVKRKKKNFIFPFIERKVKKKKRRKNCEAFYISRKGKKEKSDTQKAYFIRAVRKKGKKRLYVFKQRKICV